MWLVAVVYRFKYYFAWAISEAALILSGFCFNGYNEKGEPRWDRYSNTRIRQVTIYHSPLSLSQTLKRTFDAVLHFFAPVCNRRMPQDHALRFQSMSEHTRTLVVAVAPAPSLKHLGVNTVPAKTAKHESCGVDCVDGCLGSGHARLRGFVLMCHVKGGVFNQRGRAASSLEHMHRQLP